MPLTAAFFVLVLPLMFVQWKRLARLLRLNRELLRRRPAACCAGA